MKTLQESLVNKLVCGKHLFEKLKIEKPQPKTISVPVIKCEDNIIYKDKEWKKITLPGHKYVIYRDCYHGDKAHLAHIDDFLFQLMQFQDDYEDFDMNKDILFSSNDEQKIAEWYIKDYLKLELPEKNGDTADWVDSQPPRIEHKIYDGLWFIHDVYLGYDHIDDSIVLDKTSMENLINSINSWLGWDVE